MARSLGARRTQERRVLLRVTDEEWRTAYHMGENLKTLKALVKTGLLESRTYQRTIEVTEFRLNPNFGKEKQT